MLRTKLLILAVALVAIVCTQTVQAYPPAGVDVMNTSARVDLYDPGDPNILIETVVLTGRVVVTRGNPYDPGDGRIKINTVMDTLYMEGYSVSYGDSMYVTLNRTYPPATGYIQQITPGIDFPAESFFDVYYLITIGPPAPNPPKAVGSVRGGFHFDQETGEGKVELKLKAGSVKNAISLKPSGPPDALFQDQLSEEDAAKALDCHGCPPDAFQEPEPCGTDANGGCNMPVPAFTPINCGDTVCGTGWADGTTRDTDWYEFYLSQQVQITVSGCAEFPFIVGFVDTSDCALAASLDPYAVGDPCDTVSATRTAGPGTYWMFVAPQTWELIYPCGTQNDYWATLTCPTQQLILTNDEVVIMADTIHHIPPNGRQYKDPRKIPVYDPSGQIIAYVWHKHVVDPPEPDTDTVPTTGTMPVIIGPNPPTVGQKPDEIIQLEGEAHVQWGEPQEGYVETEIVSMNLTGESELFGPAYLFAYGSGAAVQTGEETFPAESFFDVYYQVEFPGLTVEPLSPVHMAAEIEALPPYNRKYNPEPEEYHPVIDVQDPSVIAGWVRPIHWVRPQVGACCDLLTGGCTETTPENCTDPNELFLGIGVPCVPNPCPPGTELDSNDCFDSEGGGTFTLDPYDTNCVNGISLNLTSILSPASEITRSSPPPYWVGQIINTEIVQMELSTVDPGLGLIIIRERDDKASTGQILVQAVDGGGNLTQGASTFDVFIEIDLPDMDMCLNTGDDSALHLAATIYSLPPIGDVYFPLPTQGPLKLLDAVTQVHVGWLCHAQHYPQVQIPCDNPKGACKDPTTGDCFMTTAGTCPPPYVYQGDNTSCLPNSCEDCCDHDGMRGDANYDMSLNVADLSYLVDYLFFGGPAPPCLEEADVNGDGAINVADLTYLVEFLFFGGPPPAPC